MHTKWIYFVCFVFVSVQLLVDFDAQVLTNKKWICFSTSNACQSLTSYTKETRNNDAIFYCILDVQKDQHHTNSYIEMYKFIAFPCAYYNNIIFYDWLDTIVYDFFFLHDSKSSILFWQLHRNYTCIELPNFVHEFYRNQIKKTKFVLFYLCFLCRLSWVIKLDGEDRGAVQIFLTCYIFMTSK